MPRRTPLLESLTAFQPADEAEARHRLRMIELLVATGDPFSRAHFNPGHFTASAFVLSPDLQSLLLIFHGKFHRWLQPGGHVDPHDEDLISAARREVLEETGINTQRSTFNAQHPKSDPSEIDRWKFGSLLDLDIHPIPPNPKKDEPPHEHFDVRFVFVSPTTDSAAGSDAKETRWVPLNEITEELTDASVMRAVRKLQA